VSKRGWCRESLLEGPSSRAGAPTRATVEGSDLEAGDLEAGDLEAGDLEAGDLEAGDLEAADLEAADLEAADIEAADIEEADIERVTSRKGAAGACPPTFQPDRPPLRPSTRRPLILHHTL
jgi:uncharacterized protein YjbI with pentapeptide repeats